MFLSGLDLKEKEAFISLAVMAAESNGRIADEEYQMLGDYCKELGLAFFDARNVKPMEDVVRVYSKAEDRHKKIAVLEIIGLMLSDGEYDDEERTFVNTFSHDIGVSESVVMKMEDTLSKYIDMTKELVECIE